MDNNKKFKIMLMMIIVLSVTTIGLGIYVVYDVCFSNDTSIKQESRKKDVDDVVEVDDENSKYETMSEDEIKIALGIKESNNGYNRSVNLLNSQSENILDVKKYLNGMKNDLLDNILCEILENSDANIITKEEIMKKTRELYGYDLDYEFKDIGEDSEYLDYKWDNTTQSYILNNPEVCTGHGACFHDFIIDIVDIKKNDDNSYDVTTAQLWTDSLCEGDFVSSLYSTYSNAEDEYSPLVKIDNTNLDRYDKLYEDALKKAKKVVEKGNYRYRMIKENGNIGIIQYIKTNNY